MTFPRACYLSHWNAGDRILRDLGKLGRRRTVARMVKHARNDNKNKKRSARTRCGNGERNKADLAMARRVLLEGRTGLPVRKAKARADSKLREYTEKAGRCKNVLSLRRCSFGRVRAALSKEARDIKRHVTPSAVVRTEDGLDSELSGKEAEAEDSAEADDGKEAEQFGGFDDDDRSDDGDEREDSAVAAATVGRKYEVDEDGCVYLLGESMAQWLRVGVPDSDVNSVSLTSEQAAQWGLTEARDIEWAAVQRFEGEVDMMVPADRLLFYVGEADDADLPPELSGKNLNQHCFYASSLERVREGGTAEWHPILLYTL